MSIVLVPLAGASKDFTVFDAYINDGSDLGLLFYDMADPTPQTYAPKFYPQTNALQLKPVRQDVGNNPFEVRPDFGDMFSQGDFSHGSGQAYFHRAGRDEKQYLTSEGFDISQPGKLTHLDTTASALASATIGRLAMANGLPFVADGTTIKRGDGAFPGTWSTDSPHAGEGATTVNDLVGAGTQLYAALGANGIHRRDGAGTWTHYSNVAATLVSWVKQRLVASDGRSIYEITDANPNPPALDTLPLGWVYTSIAEAAGFVLATAASTNSLQSEIRAYGLSTTLVLELKGTTPLPDNQLAYSVAGYLDSVYVGVGKANPSGGYDPILYQAFVSTSGVVTFLKIVEEKGSGATDLSVAAIAPLGESVVCGWSLGSGSSQGARTGIAVHNLGFNAFSNHLKTSSSSAQVQSILVFKGRTLVSVKGGGLYYQDIGVPVAQAQLVTSVADWANSGFKVWDLLQITHRPLPVGTSVVVEYTKQLPEEAVWLAGMTSNITGAESAEARLAIPLVSSKQFALRITSNAASGLAPTFGNYSVRSNPAPAKPEWQLVRNFRLLPRDRKDIHGEDVYTDVLATRLRLQLMRYTWVTFYEPGYTWTAWVESVNDIQPEQPLFAQTAGDTRKEFFVMEVTMIATKDG